MEKRRAGRSGTSLGIPALPRRLPAPEKQGKRPENAKQKYSSLSREQDKDLEKSANVQQKEMIRSKCLERFGMAVCIYIHIYIWM